MRTVMVGSAAFGTMLLSAAAVGSSDPAATEVASQALAEEPTTTDQTVRSRSLGDAVVVELAPASTSTTKAAPAATLTTVAEPTTTSTTAPAEPAPARPAAAPAPTAPPPTTAPPTTQAPPPPSGSAEEAIAAWFPDVYEQAVSVARCESGMNPNAVSSGGGNHGLFQINNVHQSNFTRVTGQPWSSVYSAYYNSQYARYLYNSDGWGPWGCQP